MVALPVLQVLKGKIILELALMIMNIFVLHSCTYFYIIEIKS